MKKKILPLLLTVPTLLICRYTNVSAAEKPGYVYTIIDNRTTITGFEGDPTTIEIPETVEGCRVVELRDNAFYDCTSLKQIVLPPTVEKIGHHCFYGCTSLESIVIPNSVTDLGMGTFCGCSSLSTAVIPDSLTRLPESCFRSCTALRTITLPDSITEVGDFCFSGCTSLTSVSLGESTSSLGDCSFYMCSSLKSLYIPSSVETIGLCAAGYAPTNEGAQQIEGFTILGEKKSAAKTYADENHLTFENAADTVHTFAVQQISGRRIGIPAIYLIAGALLLFTAPLLLTRKRRPRAKS